MFQKEISCTALSPDSYQENDDYLYAFDLFNHGFYWESHVWWEELWHLAGRKGDLADLLKALIKLAAAGVKINLEQPEPSIGHINRGLELFENLYQTNDEVFYGVNLHELIENLKSFNYDFTKFQDYQIKLELN